MKVGNRIKEKILLSVHNSVFLRLVYLKGCVLVLCYPSWSMLGFGDSNSPTSQHWQQPAGPILIQAPLPASSSGITGHSSRAKGSIFFRKKPKPNSAQNSLPPQRPSLGPSKGLPLDEGPSKCGSWRMQLPYGIGGSSPCNPLSLYLEKPWTHTQGLSKGMTHSFPFIRSGGLCCVY